MFIYSCWTKDGSCTCQAFNKFEKAAEYAYKHISESIGSEKYPSDSWSSEFSKLKQQLKVCKDAKTAENIDTLIKVYEDYMQMAGQLSPKHNIEEVAIVE